MGWVDKSSPGRETTTLAVEEDAVGLSTILEASRHPGKEPIGMNDNTEGRAKTPSDQIENGVDGRILEDMPSVVLFSSEMLAEVVSYNVSTRARDL
ncbi:uncharacterized protein A4U43_UnF11260 [Asparagus officinalis]|uniref:Uncharacterized protein n=1 Tax=Asparagus officinalis TaxID=4686 RepID=A0A1R3L588_ASPOF|nr:uncharacterized protein A4U43_UnF11260 [Asparagus officinalis]